MMGNDIHDVGWRLRSKKLRWNGIGGERRTDWYVGEGKLAALAGSEWIEGSGGGDWAQAVT